MPLRDGVIVYDTTERLWQIRRDLLDLLTGEQLPRICQEMGRGSAVGDDPNARTTVG